MHILISERVYFLRILFKSRTVIAAYTDVRKGIFSGNIIHIWDCNTAPDVAPA